MNNPIRIFCHTSQLAVTAAVEGDGFQTLQAKRFFQVHRIHGAIFTTTKVGYTLVVY